MISPQSLSALAKKEDGRATGVCSLLCMPLCLLIAVHTALQMLDLDGEWDTTMHDLQMSAILVKTDSASTNGDDEKLMWDNDIDIDDLVPWSSGNSRHVSASLEESVRCRYGWG
jgi:hypothetical protein